MGQREPVRRVVTWDECTELVQHIAAQVGQNEPDAIVGLTRGGLVPAVMLSHMFNVPLFCLNISLRDGMASTSKFNWKELSDFSNIIIVDDINDSGSTFAAVLDQCYRKLIARPRFASLFTKDSSKFSSLYSGEVINKEKENDWIVFPWE